MDIRYFESLIAIVELGSIARAAQTQSLTPAAVGQRIAAIESHFNVALLNRGSHKATPTEACLSLLPRLRHIVGEFHDLHSDIDHSSVSGKLNLGAISTALTGIIPAAIKQLALSAPGLILQIRPGTSNSLFVDLSERRIDIAIIVLPPYKLPREYRAITLRKEPLVLISSQTAGKSIREKLVNNPYICYDSQSWGGIKARKYLTDRKINIEPCYELDALESIEKLVQQGMGVSLVPQWAGLDAASSGMEVEVIKPDQYSRQIVLLTRASDSREKITTAISQALIR
ncbi:MAG: LysR family transcriptional regulator [Gammaproteobacteria bacterium]|nr:LysR family transcriptional regulator [Gammaproteobacteria bacterium]